MRGAVVVVACLIATVLAPASAAPAVAVRTVTLATPKVKQHATVYAGRAPARAKVRITRRTAHGWVRLATTRADRQGHYRVRAKSPSTTWRVRAATGRLTSPVRVVAPRLADPPVTGDVPPAPDPTQPAADPTTQPAADPTTEPAADPTTQPTADPTTEPTADPTAGPTTDPAPDPTAAPVAPPSDACGKRPAKADGSLWSCTFDDEFDGTALDTRKWLVQETSYSGMTSGNADCYVNNPQTVSVGDGRLRLTANRKLAPFSCPSPFGAFTTTSTAATVVTKDRFAQAYGRFEFRARFPDTAGAPGPHSAAWLYPQKNTYGAWPKSGEIDVAEWFSARPANVYPSVHYTGEQVPQSTGLNCPMPTSSSKFHTYDLEWSPTVMRFYYDDKLCFEHAWTPTNVSGSAPFDQPFYLVLTQVWGNLWNAPTQQTPDSATLEVDWVRAWQ
jgi:beta-glucanase (GH16 family)